MQTFDYGVEGMEIDTVRECLDPEIPALVHPVWEATMPWLVQGTTCRGAMAAPFDLGLHAGATPSHLVHEHWNRLLAATDMACAVYARQVHEADVRLHRGVLAGLTLTDECDGHVTDQPGVLLAVTVADCVPVFVVAPDHRAVAVLHAGWRGTAAGVLEQGIALIVTELGIEASGLRVHMGPSICGECYEVGPEVFAALGRPAPEAPRPIDLRGVLAERAAAAGVLPGAISISEHCTRCTGSGLFSHRGGDGERQVGYVGIRV